MTADLAPVDLAHRPRLASLARIGGPEAADAEIAQIEAIAVEGLKKPKISPPERFEGRTGYDEDFLSEFAVPLPAPKGQRTDDVLPVEHSTDGRLDYQHFSVVMSKRRRMAMFVAV